MSPPQADVIVLGAGAAGLFCAFSAARRGLRVLVLERANKVGKKILMSGGGRCNFTNTGTSPENFISANPHFCKSALARYSPYDFIQLVNKHGIGWHEKELGQLFCDESSKDIVGMLLDECARADGAVDIRTRCEVHSVDHHGSGFSLETSHGHFNAPSLVVATGGLSIPSLGGSGFGYELAQQFGHTLRPRRSGLVPLTLSGKAQDCWKNLSGLSFPVEVSTQAASFSNAMLLTHRGLSGPAILQISSYWTEGQKLQINLLPETDAHQFLQQRRKRQADAELKNVLCEYLPRRFAQTFCEQFAPSLPMRQYSAKALTQVAQALENWPVQADGTEGYRTAEVTLGGVDTAGVSSSTFESSLVPGLYFIGEVLDVTGWLGGYNFQWAWASANACANAIQTRT